MGRIQIPDSLPVGVRLGGSGSVPGAISSPPPSPGPQSYGVYNHVHNPVRSASPYSNVTPSISTAGSGVVTPRQAVSLSDRLAGRTAPAATAPQVQPYTPSAIPSGPANLSDRLAGRTPQPTAASPAIPSTGRLGRLHRAGGLVRNLGNSFAVGLLADVAANRVIAPVQNALLDRLDLPQPIDRLARGLNHFGRDPMRALSEQQVNAARSLACQLLGFCPSSPDGATPPERPPAPPFYGGQMSGVSYNLTTSWQSYDLNGNPIGSPVAWNPTGVIGAITYIGAQMNATGNRWQRAIRYNNGASVMTFGNLDVASNSAPQLVAVNIVRANGQPDTGGNPEPLPGTPNQLALAPLRGTPPSVQTPTGTTGTSPISPTQLAPASPVDPLTPQNPSPTSNPLAPTGNPLAPTTPTTPSNAPQLGRSPSILDNPLLPLLALPLAVPNLIPSSTGGRGSYPQLWRPPSTTSRIVTGGGTSTDPTSTCRFAPDTVSHQKLDRNFAVMEAIQIFQTGQLLQIQDKLGAQLPNGGLSAYVKNFWKWSQMDRIMNLITMWTTIHNAMMLSNNITQTLFSVFDIVFEIFDFSLKDDEDQTISTGEWVGSKFNDFLGSIFGDQNVAEVRATWNRANRIYQAAANIHNAMQSIMYSIAEGLETVGNYVALIGNASKKYGVFVENAYGWMNVNLNFRQNRFFKTLDQVQEGVEALETVASEVQSITESVSEIQTQSTELMELLREEEDNRREAESVAKGDSVYPRAPLVQDSDLVQPIQE